MTSFATGPIFQKLTGDIQTPELLVGTAGITLKDSPNPELFYPLTTKEPTSPILDQKALFAATKAALIKFNLQHVERTWEETLSLNNLVFFIGRGLFENTETGILFPGADSAIKTFLLPTDVADGLTPSVIKRIDFLEKRFRRENLQANFLYGTVTHLTHLRFG